MLLTLCGAARKFLNNKKAFRDLGSEFKDLKYSSWLVVG
jgi:hypothetical protein|tara:strand:+ start:243 stop:359 length:117 start_codon:yes stop_codon:yes gene_type:complete